MVLYCGFWKTFLLLSSVIYFDRYLQYTTNLFFRRYWFNIFFHIFYNDDNESNYPCIISLYKHLHFEITRFYWFFIEFEWISYKAGFEFAVEFYVHTVYIYYGCKNGTELFNQLQKSKAKINKPYQYPDQFESATELKSK